MVSRGVSLQARSQKERADACKTTVAKEKNQSRDNGIRRVRDAVLNRDSLGGRAAAITLRLYRTSNDRPGKEARGGRGEGAGGGGGGGGRGGRGGASRV
ncbi:hypothetical protein PUN28_002371 [Cardiocondyla obscurior]|uniref:Uncharacterized protein n=1 Tax=Cardiocondyla obscurior TaxID=286306 RepID=A0AAW2GTY8_9HYME